MAESGTNYDFFSAYENHMDDTKLRKYGREVII